MDGDREGTFHVSLQSRTCMVPIVNVQNQNELWRTISQRRIESFSSFLSLSKGKKTKENTKQRSSLVSRIEGGRKMLLMVLVEQNPSFRSNFFLVVNELVGWSLSPLAPTEQLTGCRLWCNSWVHQPLRQSIHLIY